MKYSQNIGIDFGTLNFLAYSRDKGLILSEPTVAILERSDGRIRAIGNEALELMQKFPERFQAVYPMKNGMITNYKIATGMMELFLRKICAKQVLKPKITVSIPIRAGEVAERAMVNAILDAGAISVTPIRQPFAAANGIGLDLTLGKSAMIIDIGAGTTDIAVISMGKMAVGTSTDSAGKRMNYEILKFIRKETGLEIGERLAEKIKLNAGHFAPKNKEAILKIHGRNCMSGLPEVKELSAEVLPKILSFVVSDICDLAMQVMERLPKEISDEIRANGIYLTGGGSITEGLEQYCSEQIGIACRLTKNPLQTVVIGAGTWK